MDPLVAGSSVAGLMAQGLVLMLAGVGQGQEHGALAVPGGCGSGLKALAIINK